MTRLADALASDLRRLNGLFAYALTHGGNFPPGWDRVRLDPPRPDDPSVLAASEPACCEDCDGSGEVQECHPRCDGSHIFDVERACPRCRGTGEWRPPLDDEDREP